MRVKILTTAQAQNLHKRFSIHFEIQPFPLKNDRWYLTFDTLEEMKRIMIDHVDAYPTHRERALFIWDKVVGLPTQELDDFPQYRYDLTNPIELTEHDARFSDLIFENVT